MFVRLSYVCRRLQLTSIWIKRVVGINIKQTVNMYIKSEEKNIYVDVVFSVLIFKFK